MNCKKAKKFIVTDYIDGELTEAKKTRLEGHLRACDGCRLFQETLTAKVISPFRQVREEMPPATVWQSIASHIEKKELESPIDRLVNNIDIRLRVRRPVFVLATMASVMLIVSFLAGPPLYKKYVVNSYLDEQIEFFSYLGRNGMNSSPGTDLGTNIEEYFL